jgi:L-alanine-DL-glutamate epimerase-like enolase superfamily enzyme
MPLNLTSKKSPATFKKALNKLATDQAFREKTLKSPESLTTEFKLSVHELRALRQAAVLSGADMTQIDSIRSRAIKAGLATGNLAADWDIDISCCCCCCCGETAVVKAFA